MRRLLAATSLLALVGCAHAPQPVPVSALDDASCQSYGAKPGSDMYVKCRMMKDAQRDQDQKAATAAMETYLLEHR